MACDRSFWYRVRDFVMRHFHLSDGLNRVCLFLALDRVSDDILLRNHIGKGVCHYRIRGLCHSRLQRVCDRDSCIWHWQRNNRGFVRLLLRRFICLQFWLRYNRFLFNDSGRRWMLTIKRFLEQIECKGNK